MSRVGGRLAMMARAVQCMPDLIGSPTSDIAAGRGLCMYCCVCGYTRPFRFLLRVSQSHVALRCAECGVIRVWPPADRQDDSTDAYRWRLPEARWLWFAADTYRFLIRCLGETPRSLLDVGCSTGATVQWFTQEGWSAKGIDRDRRAVEYGRSLGLPLETGTIDSLDEKFDVILLSHVFEHLPDPSAFLSSVHLRLTRGGYLYFVTPTYQSIPGWWYGAEWNGWVPGQHEWIYTRRSVRLLLKRNGYKPVKIEQRVHRGWPEARWWRKGFWWRRLPLIAVMRLTGVFGVADGLYVLARPVDRVV